LEYPVSEQSVFPALTAAEKKKPILTWLSYCIDGVIGDTT